MNNIIRPDQSEIQFSSLKEEQKEISVKKLLERPASKSYVDDWTELLAQEAKELKEEEIGVLIFRLGNEWLALSIHLFAEIAELREIHQIPHRSNKILLGMVNVRGQLKLCIALHNLLEIHIDEIKLHEIATPGPIRMLAIQKENEYWIFPVNEVFGIYHFDPTKLENVPITIVKSTANYLQGVIPWKQRSVGYLDEELIFYSLRRALI